jgi:hypothetical protein
MRAAFGLVGILITIGVIVWIMSAVELPSAQQAVNVQKQVTPQVQQIAGSGVTPGGGSMRFNESMKCELQTSGGQSSSILVTEVDPVGPAARYYTLKRGDSIVEVGQLGPVRGSSTITSSEDALIFVMDAYQHQQPLVVIRDGQKLTLPPPGSPQANGQGWVPSH